MMIMTARSSPVSFHHVSSGPPCPLSPSNSSTFTACSALASTALIASLVLKKLGSFEHGDGRHMKKSTSKPRGVQPDNCPELILIRLDAKYAREADMLLTMPVAFGRRLTNLNFAFWGMSLRSPQRLGSVPVKQLSDTLKDFKVVMPA
jgi:hypothetical protein